MNICKADRLPGTHVLDQIYEGVLGIDDSVMPDASKDSGFGGLNLSTD
jgi:hypothetical protein